MEWEEPPMMGVHVAFFDELRRHPGEWAVWRRDLKSPGGVMHKLKYGLYAGIEAGELEVRSHLTGREKTTIYVRVKETE